MKRKSLLAVLVICLAGMVGLVGCGGAAQQKNKPMFEAEISEVFTCGSYDGSTLLVVNLKVKNNSDTSLYAGVLSTTASATLDGKKLTTEYLFDDNPYSLGVDASIDPESEGMAQLVYALPSTEGTVDLVINSETVDYKGSVEILNEQIDLSTVENMVSESDYDVKVNKVTVSDDGEGSDLIIMEMTFTNNSDKATSFGSAIDPQLFQNDIELKSGYLPYNHPAQDSDLSSNTYTDIKKGASIDVLVVYKLQDTKNPVEFTCTDSRSYDKATILSKTIEVAGSSDEAADAPDDTQKVA